MQKYLLFLMMPLIGIYLSACSHSATKNDLNREWNSADSVTATVEAIDMQTRLVTIRDQNGKSIIVHAGEEVVNLPQVQVGDEIVLVIVESVAVRMAEPGEIRNESNNQVSKARPGDKPGFVKINETIISAKIEAIDLARETARLRMPEGKLQNVKVKDLANLKKAKIGDTIVITSTEAIAISVQKTSK
ncbi:MAG: hypothetical protein EHM86_00115 [Desulfobulbaceae bacterium]|nr:MAG: hypothetical protein EHM86_00115 [Desulfobulbaceae bacterium]